MPQSDRLTLSVSQLNGYVRSLLQADSLLRGLCVRGEISGFKRHVSGHLYFSLKDEGGLVRCVMFRQNAMRLPFAPRDGMRVLLTGYVSLYEAQGQYQFYGEGMERDGVGELWLRFERDRARLQAEGLFDPEKKRPLPRAPRCIGVATSPSGAVIRDIVRVAHRRNPAVDILLCPCRVQPAQALSDLAGREKELGALRQRLGAQARAVLAAREAGFGRAQARLAALDPQAVLRRGYAAVRRGREPILRAGQVRPEDELFLRFAGGGVSARALAVFLDNDEGE